MSLMINEKKKTLANSAVIYARVSSVKQTTRGDGLNSQITRCTEYAKYKGYGVVETFKDDASGSLIKRPGMQAMLTFLKKHRANPHVVIIDDISRLARGIEAHLNLRTAISGAGGILESPSIEFGEDSDSQLVENLLAAVSQHQRQKNGEQTKNRMRARIANGYWVFHPPLGFTFEKTSGHSKLLVRHEPMASVIQEALEGFASGRFDTQAEILRYFETLPYFPRDKRGIIRHQRVRDILTHPIYAGMVEAPKWDVSLRQGQHDGLISYSTFKRIQDKLNNRPKLAIKKNVAQDFPLRGFVTCGDCGVPLTSCWAKGRYRKYPYYHCPAKGCASYGKSIKRASLEGEFEELLSQLQPTRGLFDIAHEMFKKLWEGQLEGAADARRQMQKQQEQIDHQVTQLMDRIVEAASPSVIAAYEKRIQKLEADKLILTERIALSGKPRNTFEDSFRTAFDFLKSPVKLWRSGELAARKTVLKLTFAQQLSYVRGEGFRTAFPSLPFEIIQRLKGEAHGNFSSENEMAHP
ncbi:recombinase family protein [Hyphococcus lacteus]|uniref:Recombinase family protein n=1 Tax=Hyphococcus lacteus TaxID=3143536 RepID=A0ABV3Z3P5_9PROT